MDWPKLTFAFDQKVWNLRRGRYEGVIMLGCEEIDCRIDFLCDSRICFAEPTVTERAPDGKFSPHCEPECCSVISQCCGQSTEVRYEVDFDRRGSCITVIETPKCGCDVIEPLCMPAPAVRPNAKLVVEDTECGKTFTLE